MYDKGKLNASLRVDCKFFLTLLESRLNTCSRALNWPNKNPHYQKTNYGRQEQLQRTLIWFRFLRVKSRIEFMKYRYKKKGLVELVWFLLWRLEVVFQIWILNLLINKTSWKWLERCPNRGISTQNRPQFRRK